MLKRFVVLLALGLMVTLPALAADRDDDIHRIDHAARVFKEIMDTPDKGIPHGLLHDAKCIAIIPGELKFAIVFGGNYGRGVASCRTEAGAWTAPLFVAISGGSVGYQIGGSSTDLVLLFMNDHALKSLLSDQIKLGADASVAAGPVGRDATAATDVKMNAEILAYSRAKGLFAGVSLDGADVRADKGADHALYGEGVDRHTILNGGTPIPAEARPLIAELDQHSR